MARCFCDRPHIDPKYSTRYPTKFTQDNTTLGNTLIKNQISAPTISTTKDGEFNALIKETFNTRPSHNQANNVEVLLENDFDKDRDLSQLIREAVKKGAVPRNLRVSESSLLNRQKDNDEEEIKDLLGGIRSYSAIAVETNIGIQEWECSKVIESNLEGVSHLEFCKDSQVVIAAGIQNTVSSWNISTGKIIKTIITKETCAVCSGLGQWE
jgi:WD40 repeat protein